MTEDHILKSWLIFTRKKKIYNSDPLLFFDHKIAENTYRELQTCTNFFEILFVVGNRGKTLRDNLNFYIWKRKVVESSNLVKLVF